MQANTTQNNASNPTQGSQPSYGGMDQVCSGPAGMLYSLSNQLIMVYNELQDLYGKVAIAETDVQQSTIKAGAASQRSAAALQAWTTGAQAAEAIVGAVVSGATNYLETGENKTIDDEMTGLEADVQPLKDLDALTRNPVPPGRTIGDANFTPQSVATRETELKNGQYQYTGQGNATTINQHAIDGMSDQDFAQFKKELDTKITDKEKRINTLQSRRLATQQKFNSYGQIVSQGANTLLKGTEAGLTGAAGAYQAQMQVANGVQGMANSTADAARGSIGQDYAKVSDVIASARQGAQAYAQT